MAKILVFVTLTQILSNSIWIISRMPPEKIGVGAIILIPAISTLILVGSLSRWCYKHWDN